MGIDNILPTMILAINMGLNGQQHLQDSIEKVISHCYMEYDITAAEILGVLEIVKMNVINMTFLEDDEDDSGGDGEIDADVG